MPLSALARDLEGARSWRAAGWGVVAGLGLFLPLLWWLLPFGVAAVGLLSLVQAGFVAGWVALVAAWGRRAWRPAVAVAAWVAIESLRSTWPLGGFGWGTLAATQVDAPTILGVARTLGAPGVTLVLATVGIAIEEAISRGVEGWTDARATDVPADALFGVMRTPILTVLGVLSAAVLLSGEAPAPTGRTAEIGVVQAGDTRATVAAGVNRIDSDRIVRVAQLVREQTRAFADDPPALVVWPENALDADVRTERGADVRALLEEALAEVAPAPILAGEIASGPRPGTLLNRATLYRAADLAGGPGLSEGDAYVKRRPVPFGEYVPARDLLGALPPLQQIPSDVVPDGDGQVLDVAGAEVGVLICFENTFGDLARDHVRGGAEVLLVSTNNSSFGDSPMSAQHLAQSRLRAVETGRWVVHAGISGISAFIGPDGVVHQRTELFEAAAIRRDVPLVEAVVPAVRVGPAVPVATGTLTALALLVLAVPGLRRRVPLRQG